MSKPRPGWYPLIWGTLGFLAFLSGLIENHVVTMVFGVSMTLAAASTYLTSYVAVERKVKKALETVSALLVLAVFIYGYAVTGSLLLGVPMLLIAFIGLFSFVASYLLPKVQGKLRQRLA